MAKKTFPGTNKTYLQTNRTNVYPMGNLWSTFNMDYSTNVGVTRVSPRLKLNSVSTAEGLTNMGLPIAFQYFSQRMFAIAGTRMFRATAPFTANAFIEDNSTGAATDYAAGSDMTVSNDALVASTTDALIKKGSSSTGGGDWVTIGSLTSGTNHKMTYFKKFDRVYILNNISFVVSSDNSLVALTTSGDYTLSLTNYGANQYAGTSIASSSAYIWIGTNSLADLDQNNRGLLFQWDGISAQATNFFPVNAHGIVSVIVSEDDIPYVMDTNGVLSRYTGSGLKEVGRLPVNSRKNLLNAGQAVTGQFMDAKGMCFTEYGTILATVTGLNEDGSQNENFASGVYEFDLNGGCHHYKPATYTPIGSTTITDYGQNRLEAAGAIINTKNLNIASAQQSELLIGASFRNASLNTVHGIFVDDFVDTTRKKGYFVTTFFESDEVANSWDIWWATFSKLRNSLDNIVFKYRTDEEDPVIATITWVDTTHFTVADSSVGVDDYWTSGTGGEVEVLAGTGAGVCAHITNAVLAVGTWTVTIDEIATGVSNGSAYARFQKWIKIFPAEALSTQSNWAQWAIGTDSTPRIQIKGCFTFTGPREFYKGILTSNEDIKST